MCFLSFILLPQTVGISIEFCSHITRWFISCSKKTKRDRAKSALANMGSSVSNPLTCRCTYSTLCTNTLEYNANTSSHEFYIKCLLCLEFVCKDKVPNVLLIVHVLIHVVSDFIVYFSLHVCM